MSRISLHYGHSVENVDFEQRTAVFTGPDGPVSTSYDLLVAAGTLRHDCVRLRTSPRP